MLEIGFRLGKGDRVAEGARGRGIIHDFRRRNADKILISALQVRLRGDRNAAQIVESADFGNIYMIVTE